MIHLSKYVNVLEASKTLCIHPESLRRLIREERLPAHKLGNQWFIEKRKLDEFAAGFDPAPGRKKRAGAERRKT